MDIDYIHGCELLDLDIDFELCDAKKARYGLQGFRDLVGSYNKPIGSIVKPKNRTNRTSIS